MGLMPRQEGVGLVIVSVSLPPSFPIESFAWSRRDRTGLMVAMTHALVVVPLALRSLWVGALKDDPVFGYDPLVGDLLALSSG